MFALENLSACTTEREGHLYIHNPAIPYPIEEHVRRATIFRDIDSPSIWVEKIENTATALLRRRS